ncbi:MAG TPA: hypothetical protein VNZ49_15260 [Bacteroidia bacterium]|jgi:hypothetical protein|nr:hypothetical protein [Bacteroidia bacterium]
MKIFRDKISELTYSEDDRVLHIKITKNVIISLDDIIEHFEGVKELTGNKKYVALIDTSNYFKMQPEAFMHYSLEKANVNRIATAFYNPNVANIVTINFFKHYFKPPIPVEMFESMTEALAWLNDIKSQSLTA